MTLQVTEMQQLDFEGLMRACVKSPLENVPAILSNKEARNKIMLGICTYTVDFHPKIPKEIIFCERGSADSVENSGLVNLIVALYALNQSNTIKLLSQIDDFSSSLTQKELEQVFEATAVICADPKNQENTVTLLQNPTLRNGFVAHWQKEDKTLSAEEIIENFFPNQAPRIRCN